MTNRYQPFNFNEQRSAERSSREERAARNRRMYEMYVRMQQEKQEEQVAARTLQQRTRPIQPIDPSRRPSIPGAAPTGTADPRYLSGGQVRGWKPEFGGWPGAGVLENVAGVGASIIGPIFKHIPEPVLGGLQASARGGAGFAVDVAANLTGRDVPFANLKESFVPFLREFQEERELQYEKAVARGENTWEADAASFGRALEAKKFPSGVQGALELVFDPINLIPLAGPANAMRKIVSPVVRPIIRKATATAAEAVGKRAGQIDAAQDLHNLRAVTPEGQYVLFKERPGALKEGLADPWEYSPRPSQIRPDGTRSPLRHLASPTEVLSPSLDNIKNVGTVLANMSFNAIPERVRGVVGGPLSVAFKAVNPGPMLAKTPLGRALLVHMYNGSQIPDHVRLATIEFKEKWTGDRHWKDLFDIDEDGMVRNVENTYGQKSMHFLHVFEYGFAKVSKIQSKTETDLITGKRKVVERGPKVEGTIGVTATQAQIRRKGDDLFRGLTDDQKEFIREYQRFFKEGGDYAVAYGVLPKEILDPGAIAGHGYIHRYVKEFEDVAGSDRPFTRGVLKPVPPSAKKRTHIADAIAEGMNNGVRYASNPMENLDAYLHGIYRAANDKQLIARVMPLANRSTKATELSKRYGGIKDLEESYKTAKTQESTLAKVKGHLDKAIKSKNVKYTGRIYAKEGTPEIELSPPFVRALKAAKIGPPISGKTISAIPETQIEAATFKPSLRRGSERATRKLKAGDPGYEKYLKGKREPRPHSIKEYSAIELAELSDEMLIELGFARRVRVLPVDTGKRLAVKEFPNLYTALQDAAAITNKKARKERYEEIREGVVGELGSAQKNIVNKRAALGSARREKSVLKESEDVIKKIPEFRHLIFGKEEAGMIAKALGVTDPSQFQKAMESAGRVGDTLRILKSGFDFGAPLLHGLPQLAVDIANTPFGLSPVKITKNGRIGPWKAQYGVGWQKPGLQTGWAKATLHHFKAFNSPELHQKFIAENATLFREMVDLGIPISGAASDYYVGARKDAILPKIFAGTDAAVAKTLERGGVPGGIVEKVTPGKGGARLLEKFEASFDAFGDYIRLETYKALKETASKAPGGLQELGAYIRNSTGAINPSAMGVAPSQQALERAALFYSPRYTRASMALLTDVFRGGLRGDRARKAVGSMLMAGLGTHYTLATLMGQEPKLDPTRADFLSVKVAGQNIGPGSFFVSMLRTFTTIVQKGVTSPSDLKDLNTRDNPILKSIRSRGAPASGIAWDIATGADFLGNTLEPGTDWAKHIFQASLPFALESALFDNDQNFSFHPERLPAEIVGSRAYPITTYQLLADARDEVAFNEYGERWRDLNKLQQKTLENAVKQPELDALTKLYRQDRVARGDEFNRKADEYYQERDAINERWGEIVEEGLAELEDPFSDTDLPRFREITLANANLRRKGAMELLQTSDEYADLREHWTEVAQSGLGSVDAPEDIAYLQYLNNIVANPDFEYAGERDYDAEREATERFRAEWGDEVYSYVLARLQEGRDMVPLVQEYYDGIKQFDFYWRDVDEQIFAARPDSHNLRELVNMHDRSRDIDREALKKLNPALNGFLKMRSNVRRELRKQDASLDAFLYRWGVGGAARVYAPENENREGDLRDSSVVHNWIRGGIRRQ